MPVSPVLCPACSLLRTIPGSPLRLRVAADPRASAGQGRPHAGSWLRAGLCAHVRLSTRVSLLPSRPRPLPLWLRGSARAAAPCSVGAPESRGRDGSSLIPSLGTREQGRVPARGLVSVTLALLGCGHTPRAARKPTASAGTDLARQAWQASHGHAGCTTHPPHPPPAPPSPANTPCTPMGSWPRVAARRPSLWHPTKAFPGRGRHTDISRGGVGGGRPAGGSPR